MVWLKLGYEETLDMPMPLLEHLYQAEIDRHNWIAGRPLQFRGAGEKKSAHHHLTAEIFDALFS